MNYIKKTDKKKAWAVKQTIIRNQIVTRTINKIFQIYCEGVNTEPTYFKSFPVNSETKVEAIGFGRSRTALVNHILDLLSSNNYLPGQSEFDPDRQIWCVFDRDIKGVDKENEDYNNAISIAIKNGLNVAYSNDAFELWFVLHDKYLDVEHTRDQYYEHLSNKFGINYEVDGKSDAFGKSLYEIYLSKQPNAIRNAKKLHSKYKSTDYCNHCPCTTVYLLVEELNKYLKK